MMHSLSSLSACLCAVVCFMGAVESQAGSDGRTENLGSASAAHQEQSAEDKFDATFAKGMVALKNKSLEEARLLFIAAGEAADISKFPMSWLTAQFNACHAFCLQGRKAEAEALAKQIVIRCESSLGEEDRLTSEALGYLAFVLTQNGHLADAEPVYRRNVQVLESKYGDEHYLVATAISKHASLLQSLGRVREAEKLQRKALSIVQKVGVDSHPDFCYFLTNLAYCLQAAQKTDEA
ncbi:MAG: tetratricopeptide repeat protein, partial [Verrucomicrobiaceae bacterium]|nr:tetratricopeptide repeat protein [Verrucomicrobiaceae bacterium]